MNKKQATLFQSWGNRAATSEQKPIQPAAQASTSSVNDDVIDLCGSFEDDDDDLLCEAEESVSNVSGHTIIANNSREHANDQDQHVGDVSVGADGFMPTQAQTQNSNLTGFDKSAGKLWIYPTNYPVRDYQFDIVKQALFKNTMVTLPTGLGKTFIAAVVMYNFYRWYPQGKVIFMAPTKPLVAQQIEACYNIMGIPQDHTAEMTGSMGPSKRERAWHDKRVFFLTPQVLTNDLSRGSCPAHYVKCLVIDEAHKALGNHAYCQVVRELVKYTENFRVLSLSATPGSDIKAVQQVLNNLLISQIEIRTEDSNDIKKYSHERKVDKVVVPLGVELTKVKTKYIQIMDVVVNKLKRYGVLYNRDTTSLSKFLILKAREAFRQNPPEKLQRNQYGIVEGDFALAMSLYHGFELLQLHGSRSLYNFLEGILTGDKGYGRTRTELTRNADFNELIGLLSGKYTAPESETASQARAKPFVIGHPKMEKLQKIVLDHFNTHSDAGTRVMIFSQYRDSVQEITDMLHVHQPIIKVMSFIGQATAGKSTKGFTQKEQLKVMKQFREGGYNTLVSTCVGEEGLDIGDVDLIICFDAHKSPIRLVQRMGRTGRKREGRIVMLVTQGKEEQIYNQSQYSKKSIHQAILNGAKSLHFYQHSPRMLPENSVPTCHKMHITVKENFKPTRKISTDKEANQSKITTMMTDAASKKDQSEEIITLEEYRELEPWLIPDEEIPKLPTSSITCLEQEDTNEEQQENGRFLSLSEWTPWQNTLQDTKLVDHSLGSKHLVQIMEFIQLQQSLDPSDDPYGLEMAAYLNEEDILKPGETEVPALLTFLAPKQNKTNGDKGKIGKKSDEKPKSRRSENLPKFDFLDDRMEISSDESLPEFEFSRVTKETGDIENSELGITRKPDTVQKKLTVTRKVLNDENIPAPDIHEVNDIDKKFEDCTNKTTDVVKDVQNSSLKSKKSGFVSKAKSLEKRMTIGNARRRKKHRQNSGYTSIIEFIADDDLADFDCSRVVSDMLSKKQCVENEDAAGSRPLIEENCQILSDDSDSELCKISSFKDMSTEIFRIRTPPSVEEVAKVCEAFGTGSKFGDVDFIDAIDEWHRENKQGKYIVYPESMLNDSITDFCRNRKSDKKKMSISVVDIKLKEPFSNEKLVPDKRTQIERMDNKRDKTVLKTAIDNPNSNALTDMNTFCAIDNPNSNAFTDMNTSCALDNPNSNAFTDMNTSADLENGLKLKNRKKLFKSPLNDKQVDKECLKENEKRKIRHSVHVDDEMEVDFAHDILLKSPTFVASDGKHHLKENEIKFTHLDMSDQDDTDLNEKDDIACTGNFMLNADDMFSASDDWMAEDLVEMKDKSNEASSVLLRLSESKKLAEKGMYDNRMLDNDLEITHVSDNNTSAKLQKSSNCTSSLDKNKRISGADYSFVTENIGKKRNYNNESSSNQKVNMSFSNLDKPKYDSFLSDDKDDDLFMGITTPSATKTHETSTQITFTQALDFVHSGIGASGSSEACIKSHGYENGHGFENKINASKNRIIENPSPKFNLKKTLLGFNSTDESISDEDERQIKDCSKVINYNMSIVDEDVSEEGRDLSEKKVSRKESSSSESVIDMPEFDLGFEFDDDVIPPSPKATQVSQKSSSNRLSQAFTFTNCLSQSRCDASGETFYDDKYGSKLEKIKVGERNNFGANNVKVLKSKKSLDLNDTHIEDVEKSIKNNEEESQSLFNDIVNVPLRPLSKKTKFSLDAIQENSEDDFFENTEKDVVNSKTHSDNETKTSGKIENGITEPFATKSDLNTEQEIEGNCTGAFETSFALLGEDLEDWIDSGAEFQVQNDPKPKNDNLTNFDNEKSCDSFLASQKSLENFRQKVNTPVAAVSPITFSQEKNDKHSVRDKQAKELPLRLNKNVRKSVFRLDDLSSDSFDDSFNFTSDMVLDKGTSRTSTGMMPVLHNTSTPLIHQSKKVQSVTPFRMSENNNPDRANDFTPVKASDTLPDLNTHSESPFREMSRIPEGTPIQKADESGRYLSRLDSSEEKDDDSFIVRRKKKVKILDSPLTQKENIVKNCMTKDQSHEKDNQEKSKKGTAFMISSDDDDSFMLIKNNYTTKKSIPQLEQSSDEDFEESFAESNIQVPWKNASKDITINDKRKQHEKVKLKSKQKRTSNPFIDEEAELSEEGDSNASSDEHEGSDLDRYEGSFISDSQNTQSQALNDTDVHALYLKSVKSPVGHRGGFKLQFNHRTDVDVFSQKPPPEDSHYMEDSFCVGSADEEEEDDWLLGEGGDESEEELREVTLIQNSVMHTGRKRRRGLQAFQTSRQRAIQMGRMKALSEIRTKLAGKMKRPAKKQKLSSSEDENGKVDAPKTKRSRIQLNNDTSSDEENVLVLNRSDLMSPKVQPMPKSKKRSRLLLSSENSESEDEFYESRSMCRSNKSVKLVNRQVNDRNENLNGKSVNKISAVNGHQTADELRQERLRKQKEKQAEYRRQMAERKVGDSKGLDSIVENSSTNALTKLKEKSVTNNEAHNDDFDFVRPINEDKFDDTDLLINSTVRNSKFDGKLVILVDSKEISGSQDIISDLRFKHDINVSAAQLHGCDYIVSNRMAVERKQWSEFSNGSNRAKLIERMQYLGELYDRPCLIVEKDRIKPGEEKSVRQVHWTKYVDRTIALLQRSDIKILFTDNFTETAVLLADLCRLEHRKNMAIQVPIELNDEQSHRVKFFVSLPKLSYVHALNLCDGFKSVSDFLKSSAVLIECRGKMSKNRAVEVYNYIRRMFDQNLLPTNYK